MISQFFWKKIKKIFDSLFFYGIVSIRIMQFIIDGVSVC